MIAKMKMIIVPVGNRFKAKTPTRINWYRNIAKQTL